MKSTIIFLHGGPGLRDYLRPYFEELNDSFSCVFYDQIRGSNIKIEDMIDELDEKVRSIPGKIILCGHSWGAILATEYAAKNPTKISALILMSTGLNHRHWKDEYYKELDHLGLNDAGLEEIFLAPNEIEAGTLLLNSSGSTFSQETFSNLNEHYLKNFDVTPLLKELKIPVINIFGEKDVRFPTRVAKEFRLYKNDILDFEIPGVGHFPFLQKHGKEEIYRILKGHLPIF